MQLSPDQFPGARPSQMVMEGADRYRKKMGITSPVLNSATSFVPPSASRAMGQAYDNLQDGRNDPETQAAYRQLSDHIGRQYDHMTAPTSKGGMGIDVDESMEDPYGNPYHGVADQLVRRIGQDVENNHHITVLSTNATGGRPYGGLTPQRNTELRAVHDVMGHVAAGRAVDSGGEEAAYQSHASLFPPETHRALSTEFRGQYHGMLQDQQFRIPKMGLMPANLSDPHKLPMKPGEDISGALIKAHQQNARFGMLPDEELKGANPQRGAKDWD